MSPNPQLERHEVMPGSDISPTLERGTLLATRISQWHAGNTRGCVTPYPCLFLAHGIGQDAYGSPRPLLFRVATKGYRRARYGLTLLASIHSRLAWPTLLQLRHPRILKKSSTKTALTALIYSFCVRYSHLMMLNDVTMEVRSF